MKVRIEDVRCAFPEVFEAKAFNEGKPKFKITALFAPSHPAAKQVKEAMIAAAKEKWGAKAAEVYKSLEAANKLCLQNGDSKPDLDGYAGNLFVNASSDSRPLVIDADKSPLTRADGKPYGGCYVNLVIEVWAQDNQFGKRINANLKGVQFRRDGDAFGAGGAASVDEFDSVSDNGGADDFV